MVDCTVPRLFITKAGVPTAFVDSRMKVLLAASVVEVMSVGRLSVVPLHEKTATLLALIETVLSAAALRKLYPEVPPNRVSVEALPAVPHVTSPEHVSGEDRVLPAKAM